ncbi:MAG: MerR family transcriptional regulator [Actinomycetota bacterium]|nr:MerR family transcriptional regulator [Actinomycetota bacterium]
MALPSPSYYTIGQVLEKLRDEFPGVAVSKIRYWESIGLIKPLRAPSGFRKFCDNDIEDIRKILRTQRDLGVPLEVIRKRMGNKAALHRSDQPLLGFEEDLDATQDEFSQIEGDPDSATFDRRKYMRIFKDHENVVAEAGSLPEIDLASIASIPASKVRGTKVLKASPRASVEAGDKGHSEKEEPSSYQVDGDTSSADLRDCISDIAVARDSAEDKRDNGLDAAVVNLEATSSTVDGSQVYLASEDINDAAPLGAVVGFASTKVELDHVTQGAEAPALITEDLADRSINSVTATKRGSRSTSTKVSKNYSGQFSGVEASSKGPESLVSGAGDGVSNNVSGRTRRSRSVAQRATTSLSSPDSTPLVRISTNSAVASEVTRNARSKQAASSVEPGAERRRRDAKGILDAPSFELQIPSGFLSLKDFSRRSGASEQFVSECADFGLVKVKKHQGVVIIADHYLDIVELAKSLSIIGIAPRHLRSIKLSVTKDFSYISQLVASPLASRNSKAKRKAVEQAAILEQNFERFRSMVMREMLNDLFEGYDK